MKILPLFVAAIILSNIKMLFLCPGSIHCLFRTIWLALIYYFTACNICVVQPILENHTRSPSKAIFKLYFNAMVCVCMVWLVYFPFICVKWFDMCFHFVSLWYEHRASGIEHWVSNIGHVRTYILLCLFSLIIKSYYILSLYVRDTVEGWTGRTLWSTNE